MENVSVEKDPEKESIDKEVKKSNTGDTPSSETKDLESFQDHTTKDESRPGLDSIKEKEPSSPGTHEEGPKQLVEPTMDEAPSGRDSSQVTRLQVYGFLDIVQVKGNDSIVDFLNSKLQSVTSNEIHSNSWKKNVEDRLARHSIPASAPPLKMNLKTIGKQNGIISSKPTIKQNLSKRLDSNATTTSRLRKSIGSSSGTSKSKMTVFEKIELEQAERNVKKPPQRVVPLKKKSAETHPSRDSETQQGAVDLVTRKKSVTPKVYSLKKRTSAKEPVSRSSISSHTISAALPTAESSAKANNLKRHVSVEFHRWPSSHQNKPTVGYPMSSGVAKDSHSAVSAPQPSEVTAAKVNYSPLVQGRKAVVKHTETPKYTLMKYKKAPDQFTKAFPTHPTVVKSQKPQTKRRLLYNAPKRFVSLPIINSARSLTSFRSQFVRKSKTLPIHYLKDIAYLSSTPFGPKRPFRAEDSTHNREHTATPHDLGRKDKLRNHDGSRKTFANVPREKNRFVNDILKKTTEKPSDSIDRKVPPKTKRLPRSSGDEQENQRESSGLLSKPLNPKHKSSLSNSMRFHAETRKKKKHTKSLQKLLQESDSLKKFIPVGVQQSIKAQTDLVSNILSQLSLKTESKKERKQMPLPSNSLMKSKDSIEEPLVGECTPRPKESPVSFGNDTTSNMVAEFPDSEQDKSCKIGAVLKECDESALSATPARNKKRPTPTSSVSYYSTPNSSTQKNSQVSSIPYYDLKLVDSSTVPHSPVVTSYTSFHLYPPCVSTEKVYCDPVFPNFIPPQSDSASLSKPMTRYSYYNDKTLHLVRPRISKSNVVKMSTFPLGSNSQENNPPNTTLNIPRSATIDSDLFRSPLPNYFCQSCCFRQEGFS